MIHLPTLIKGVRIRYGLMVNIVESDLFTANQETNKFEECQYKLQNYNINTMKYWIYFEPEQGAKAKVTQLKCCEYCL